MLKPLNLKEFKMFDISMAELGVILVVMLIVLGPQKATETARNIGRFISKIKMMVSNINSEINSYTSPIKEGINEIKNLEDEIHSSVMDLEDNDLYHSYQSKSIKKNKKPLRKKVKTVIPKKKLKKLKNIY